MQSHELINFIERIPSLKNHFIGVFSIDTLPTLLNNRQFLFCNTALSNSIGEHWFCVTNFNDEIELFDSLGVYGNKKHLYEKFCHFKLNGKKAKVKVNDIAVQPSNSISCGLFVLYFAIHRLHNADLGFNTLLNEIFSSDVLNNELEVHNFCKDF